MKWKDGKRIVRRFAWDPVELEDGTVVQWRFYYEKQRWRPETMFAWAYWESQPSGRSLTEEGLA